MHTHARTIRALTLAATAIAATATLATLTACFVPAAIGGMAESYQRTGSTTYPAQYDGLVGKSFAVVTSSSRMIEAEHPGLSARITQRVNDRLIQNANPGYAIPSRDLLTVLYNTPQWTAMTRADVAKLLGVERLIVIEIIDYRLQEPGNQYTWDGAMSGIVSVFESDSAIPDDPMFEKAIRITFPDSPGFTTSDIPEPAVTTELSNRFINRAAWLFYEHEEPNVIPY